MNMGKVFRRREGKSESDGSVDKNRESYKGTEMLCVEFCDGDEDISERVSMERRRR